MTAKKVLILNGSPRPGGNTSILCDQIRQGVEEAGGEAEIIYLHGLDISPCDACDSCQDMDEIDCILEDDMQMLYPKIRDAGALVYASPVYWFTVSAQLKIFMDRCYGFGGEKIDRREHALAGKKMGVALAYEGVDPYDSGAINAIRSFQDMFRYLHADLVGIVYGQAHKRGEIRKRVDVLEQALALGKQLVAAL